MMKKCIQILLLVALIPFAGCKNDSLKVTELRCMGLDNPMGVENSHSRLSWILVSSENDIKQSAYRVLVSSSSQKLHEDKGDLWDSKKVKSDNSTDVVYLGTALRTGDKVYWKVKIWDQKNRATDWSKESTWTMGVLNPADWKAKWIGLNKAVGTDKPDIEKRELSARYLRKEFSITKPVKRATAYMCGLGLSELYINGKKIGDHVLSPGLTEYPKRSLYVEYDVTPSLQNGNNTIGTILGNGRFFAPRLNQPIAMKTFDFPKLLFQIELQYEDGTKDFLISDESWKITANGPIRKNNEYDGEYYDARMEMPGWNENNFPDTDWSNVEVLESPSKTISSEMIEPIRITQVLKPVKITNPKPGVFIFDMGQNMVGWTKLKVKAEKGTNITQRFAETLKNDGTLYLANIRGAEVTDTYIAKGEGTESWEPRFTYHGFRYVEMTGFPGTPDLSTIEGEVVNDDLEVVGEFECSNELINKIYKNAFWGIRGNYRSIPTDAPRGMKDKDGWVTELQDQRAKVIFLMYQTFIVNG